jgi:cytochrome b pre-mRNA-processing protein 3
MKRTPAPLLNRIRSLLRPSAETVAARHLFAAIMAEARSPELYAKAGVADTIDGRFDLVVLYLYFVLKRLKSEGLAGRALGQQLFDVAFAGFDEALREIGVGDLSVGKKIRMMAEAFYGRVEAYEQAQATPETFEAALVRNVYRGAPPNPQALAVFTAAVGRFRQKVDLAPLPSLLRGEWLAASRLAAG